MRLCCLLSAAPHGSRCTARPCCCRGLAHPARGMLQPCRMLCPSLPCRAASQLLGPLPILHCRRVLIALQQAPYESEPPLVTFRR